VASRRSADALIASGRVLVNGRRPPPQGLLVEPGKDRVSVDGAPVAPAARHRYLALNKPPGVIVTARDPGGRTTAQELLADAGPGRLFAVGRLDVASRGLLLMTDDGELAHRLAHPRYKVPKEYLAAVAGRPAERDLRRLRDGVELEDGPAAALEAELVGAAPGGGTVRLVIREVRRMLEAVGHPVRELTRTAYGPVRLGRLREGGWRRLRDPEVAALRRAVGLESSA
jgi:23S rRNA pseudouridine2605 synthase